MERVNNAGYLETLASVKKTQEIFNSKWKLQILVTMMAGIEKFNDLGRSLAGISSKVLTKELRELEDAGIINRTVSEIKQEIRYSVKNKSPELRQVIAAYRRFGVTIDDDKLQNKTTKKIV